MGSDSWYYQQDEKYNVICIGEAIGVENYTPDFPVHGIIANPVCTEFSTAEGFHITKDLEKGMFLVNHCLRIIESANPEFWVIENPANGRLKEFLGKPDMVYQPWEFGSPWTKKTALKWMPTCVPCARRASPKPFTRLTNNMPLFDIMKAVYL